MTPAASSNVASSNALGRRGLMLVLSSPSGAGKTTLSRKLLEQERPGLELSVSVTTRKPRPGEIDGRDYHFIDMPRFEAMARNGELLESAEVFGNRYGTPRGPVETALSQGRDVLFDIDWQGTQQLGDSARADLVSVFVLPPSSVELERRLHTRAQDDEATIRIRMAKASDELSHYFEYDYVVINHEIEQAFLDVRAILAAERLKRERQTGLSAFVRGLQSGL